MSGQVCLFTQHALTKSVNNRPIVTLACAFVDYS